jgi:phage terminase large subunit-like protein
VLPHFWIPQSALRERVRQKKTRLDAWVASKLITVTDGNAADYDKIEEDILGLASTYRIRRVGIDKWNSLQIAQHLMDGGLDLVAVGQGYGSLNGPTKLLEQMVVSRKIAHDGNPVLRWMFGNVAIKQDPAGNLKPDKSKAADKIDGVAALLDALAAWMEDADAVSPYEGQGIDFV